MQLFSNLFISYQIGAIAALDMVSVGRHSLGDHPAPGAAERSLTDSRTFQRYSQIAFHRT